MKRLLYIFMAVIFCALLASCATLETKNDTQDAGFSPYGFNLTLQNDTEVKQYYQFYWVDHMWRSQFSEPVPLAVGELEPGAETKTGKYAPGGYFILWGKLGEIYKSTVVIIGRGIRSILSTPMKEEL